CLTLHARSAALRDGAAAGRRMVGHGESVTRSRGLSIAAAARAAHPIWMVCARTPDGLVRARPRAMGGRMSDSATAAGALDHVVVLFESRSLDNVLGHLYGPGDGKRFEGVVGKALSNPIPDWAEHGAERQTVPYTVATDMDSPNPDSGEEWFHTNTQLFNVL